MSTTVTKTKRKPRYLQVIEVYDQARERVIELTGITREEYIEMEFQWGCKLVDTWFKDAFQEEVQRYKADLLYRKEIGYWDWFCVQRQQMEYAWVSNYFLEEETRHGVFRRSEAEAVARNAWKQAHADWVENIDTHSRLLFWMHENYRFKLYSAR